MRLRQHQISISLFGFLRISAAACIALMVLLVLTIPVAQAATAFDGNPDDMGAIQGDQWWFNFLNWSAGAGTDGTSDPPNFLPPAQDTGSGTPTTADAQINEGLFLNAEGVVYDPDNDPWFNNAVYMSQFSYPTGSPATAYVGDYGPQNLYRLYIARNTTNTNLLTIKSGNMSIADTTVIGRSGSTVSEANLGRVNQLGGSVRLPLTNLDMGNREASGWGNGTWDYEGGTLNVASDGGVGIRLASGGSAGAGGMGTFIMGNPGNGSGGYVRTYDFLVASHSGTNDGIQDDKDPDGVTRGVGIVEFHYNHGGTRPIQVQHNLTINNGQSDVEGDESRIRSSRLTLMLDEPPVVDMSGVPNNLGLFDVDSGGVNGGVINGTGDIDGNGTPNQSTDQVFSNIDNTGIYSQGSIVEAMFGASTYRWTISYTGDIAWNDLDTSDVASISGTGGTDVVLVGLDSTIVAGLLGDYNEDDELDAADYTVWRDAMTAGATTLPNDPTPGTVDESDFDYWRAHFGDSLGSGAGSASAAVPEPGSLVLAVLAVLGLMSFRSRS